MFWEAHPFHRFPTYCHGWHNQRDFGCLCKHIYSGSLCSLHFSRSFLHSLCDILFLFLLWTLLVWLRFPVPTSSFIFHDTLFGIGINTALHTSLSVIRYFSRWVWTSSTVHLRPLFLHAFQMPAGMSSVSVPADCPFLIWGSTSNTAKRCGNCLSTFLSGQYVCWWSCASYSFIRIPSTIFYLLCFSQCIAILIINYICNSWLLRALLSDMKLGPFCSDLIK